MRQRIGCRVEGAGPLDPVLFGDDLGEDWVVPRAGIAYLVVRAAGDGAVLSGYGPDGHLCADRHAASTETLIALLDALHASGRASRPVVIPDGEASALRFLARGGAP